MLNYTVLFPALLLLGLGSLPLAAELKDCGKCKDPALFTRMPGFFLPEDDSVDEKEFDGADFDVPNADPKRVEGHLMRYRYVFDEAKGAGPGFLRVRRNYENAALRIGGKVVNSTDWNATLMVVKNGRETWVRIAGSSNHDDYELVIVEKAAMQQDVVANAAALASGLAESGHVEVPGILFDTAQSTLKPESMAAVEQVAAMLKQNAALKVWVVGHTDSVGSAASNVALSNARAASVVAALVKLGIAPSRLAPFGAGPYAPVASNKAEAGRARNRRVELVEQ
jgi:outer membrane protein OmpA-like peptidoglycan-associated protein